MQRRIDPRSESAAASVQSLNTPPGGATLHRRFIATHEPVLAPAQRKGARRRQQTGRPVHEHRARPASRERQVEFKGDTRGPIRLPLNGFTYS